ncbi:MAG TPA: class I SAM-dependent methyltransferase [Candidatus Dormibacteraeota bacterium]|nr:class I SAM-dependent methyltransferase [Candidatus Dormibacteraeota bacterium]
MARLRSQNGAGAIPAAAGARARASLVRARDRALSATFVAVERLGFHLLPVTYFSPVPDTRRLGPELWSARTELAGVTLDGGPMLELAARWARTYGDEMRFPLEPTGRDGEYYVENTWYQSADAETLYSMVRDLKPRRVVEIGSGYSTLLTTMAAARNAGEGRPCEVTCIEPYPAPWLRGVTGVTRLIDRPVQTVPLDTFEDLGEGDILFIDSSHVLRIGSDVQYEFLEILPRLARGVVVHVHDIFLPAEYPRPWITESHRFLNEQYLLQAFLAFNTEFEVLWAASWMHLNHPAELEAAFPSYRRELSWPSSFWIRRRPATR